MEESDLISQLRRAIQESGLALAEIARRTNVDHSRLSRFVRGERTLTLPGAAKICELLGLRLVQERPPRGEASDDNGP